MPATKDEIAERFWRHVEHYGFAKTSVGEVARELGVSKTTVYQHFSSKDDILHYVIQQAARQEADRIVREYAGLPTYWARIEKFIREDVLKQTRDWLDRHQETEARHQFELGGRIARETYHSLMVRWVTEGTTAGEFRSIAGDPELTARFMGAVALDATEQIREDRGRDIDDAVIEAGRRLLACRYPRSGKR
jgi:AcrR family transcriptional regulator